MKKQVNGLTDALRTRSTRKLCLITLLIFLALTALVIASVFLISMLRQADLLDNHLRAYPKIIEERVNEILTREAAYSEDFQIRSELGAMLYEIYGEDEKSEPSLEAVRDFVSAACVARCDRSGKVLEISDPEESTVLTPEIIGMLREEKVLEYIYEPVTYDYVENPRFYALLPSPLEKDQDLIFAFDCTALVRLAKELSEWDDVLDRVISGLDDCTAYLMDIETGALGRYPRDELSEEKSEQLKKDLLALFPEKGSSVTPSLEQDLSRLKVVKLLDENVISVSRTFRNDGRDVTIALAVSIKNFVRPAFLSITAIVMISALGLILFIVYATRRMKNVEFSANKRERCRQARRLTLPGLVILLAVTAGFIVMIMLLENRANTASTVISQREAVQSEIAYQNAQHEKLRTELPGMVKMRADALAKILTENPELRTRENLQRFCRVIQADYLMLFDQKGREVCASNTYTGFSVSDRGSDPSNVYYPLLLGYPSVVTEPEENAATGDVIYTAGSLITDEEGMPDGFILVAENADGLSELLDFLSAEETVNRFITLKNQAVALADDSTGRFVAHTDPSMIGTEVSSVIKDALPGASFEGYTRYGGRNAYLSSRPEKGKTLMAISQGELNEGVLFEMLGVAAMVLAVILLFGVVFFRCAASLISKAESETKKDGEPETRSMLGVFVNGYGIFMVVLSIVASFAARNGHWPAFAFVFDWKWSRGVHLFSIWTALFVLADGFYLTVLLHQILSVIDRQFSPRQKTVIRLTDSLVTYTAVILLIGYTLYFFGVNMAAIYASAGLVTIAVGMGSRDLVTDILAGIFMLLEGSLHIGDSVMIGGWKGIVTDMGIRTTKITNENQEVKIMNNSRISDVVNMSREAQPSEKKKEE